MRRPRDETRLSVALCSNLQSVSRPDQTSLVAANFDCMRLAVFSRLWLHVFSLSANDVQCTRNSTHALGRISSDACHGKYNAQQSLTFAAHHDLSSR